MHTYEKGLPPCKQDLLTYTKKDSLLYTKKTHGKFLLQIPTAISRGKKPRQIPAANSHGKFPRQILKYAIHKDLVEHPLCGRASRVKIKRKQVANKVKAIKINLIN